VITVITVVTVIVAVPVPTAVPVPVALLGRRRLLRSDIVTRRRRCDGLSTASALFLGGVLRACGAVAFAFSLRAPRSPSISITRSV
ncbi:MAG: hypothetical protein M3454_03360, partial [Actinomycetota bacterium]|nr:hypothetical protein [Actinomycetota bacterium]